MSKSAVPQTETVRDYVVAKVVQDSMYVHVRERNAELLL